MIPWSEQASRQAGLRLAVPSPLDGIAGSVPEFATTSMDSDVQSELLVRLAALMVGSLGGEFNALAWCLPGTTTSVVASCIAAEWCRSTTAICVWVDLRR